MVTAWLPLRILQNLLIGGRTESGLIAKTIPFIDKSIIEKAFAGEPNYRRLLEDITKVA